MPPDKSPADAGRSASPPENNSDNSQLPGAGSLSPSPSPSPSPPTRPQLRLSDLPAQQPPATAASAGSTSGKPALHLAIPDAGEKMRLQEQIRLRQPVTAPIRSQPLELPATGYFAPRGKLGRAATTIQQPSPKQIAEPKAVKEDESKKGNLWPKKLKGKYPRLRFASRDSVHTINSPTHDSTYSHLNNPIDYQPELDAKPNLAMLENYQLGPNQPSGIRRRMTSVGTNLMQIGRSLNYDQESDSESSDSRTLNHRHEQDLERLLDERTMNEPTNPLKTNLEANNAEVAATSAFYPHNPAMQNPGVIHVSMNGHETAKTIVDSMLGTIGTSTAKYRKEHADELKKGGTLEVTPAELESGFGTGKITGTEKHGDDSTLRRRPQKGTHPGQHQTEATPPPMTGSGAWGATHMGLNQMPTTLRGVYANLSKLQMRMAEHAKLREQREREMRRKEAKRLQEKLRKEQKRKEEEKRREQKLKAKAATMHEGLLDKEKAALTNVSSKILQIPGKLPGILKSHQLLRSSGAQTPLVLSESPAGAGAALSSAERQQKTQGEAKKTFEVHGFHSVSRPQSIIDPVSLLGTIPAATYHSKSLPASRASTPGGASTPLTSPFQSPSHSAVQSPSVSPLGTPGWDEILLSSGMLTNGSTSGLYPSTPAAGATESRGSRITSDSTLMSFEAEKQKLLAQLADIFNRQNFLLVVSRALMAFGAPLHRLEANLVAIALHLDVEACVAVLPGIILISFGDKDTRSSETHIVRIATGYDMHRLERTNRVVRRVLKNKISVGQGLKNLEKILATPPLIPWWLMIIDYVVCSFFISPLFWGGRWRDAGVGAMLGFIVGLLQLLAGRFANYANLFEVSSAFIVSFIAALLQDYICFGFVSFAGIAMLLPGLALTLSIVEMASRNMIAGTIRFVYAMAQCFMLGYGISVGSTLGTRVLGRDSVNLINDQMKASNGLGNCGEPLSKFWWFLFLPALCLSFNICISAHWRQWPSMVFSGCLAYTVSYFASMSIALQPIAPAIAAFAMGLFANVMASFSNHRSAIEPILGGVQLLVPGSLGLKTVLAYISSSGNSSGTFLYNMFSTSLSIAVGLFLSGMIVFPNRKKRVGLMTF